MPVFEYQATDPQGQAVSGTLFGTSLTDAANDLAQRGFNVLHLGVAAATGDPIPADFKPVETAKRSEYPYEVGQDTRYADPLMRERSKVVTEVVAPLVGKIALPQLLFFFRQLAQLLHAGVSVVQALDTLSGQTYDPRLKGVIRELRDQTQAGRPMSFGMQRYPEVFNPLMVSLVRAGEEGGMLENTMRQIADYIDREIELRNLIRRVTFYPKLVLVFSVIVILGTNAIIASLGKQGGLSSPLTTPATWIWLAPLIVGIFLFVRVGLHNPRIKYNWDLFLLAIPILGNTLKQLSMAKFGRAFGALYKGGVAPTRAIELAADACGNEYLRARIRPAAQMIKEGYGVTESFGRTGAFSQIVLDMTRTGEMTGNLDQMLEQLAVFYEDEARTRSHQFGYVFGLFVLVCVAAYVLYVVAQFYMGYFSGVMQNAPQ